MFEVVGPNDTAEVNVDTESGVSVVEVDTPVTAEGVHVTYKIRWFLLGLACGLAITVTVYVAIGIVNSTGIFN